MIVIMLAQHLSQLLALADRVIRLGDGQRLFGVGDPVRFLFIVREGSIQMHRRQPDGAALVLQRAARDELVAEASLFAQHYHCEAMARGPTLLARMPKASVAEHLLTEPAWLKMFAAHLAAEVQRTRARAELLSLRKVGERVDAWLSLNSGLMPDRGGWVDWATELSVSPEALYRELASRRQ